jgi:hypothetical protein
MSRVEIAASPPASDWDVAGIREAGASLPAGRRVFQGAWLDAFVYAEAD